MTAQRMTAGDESPRVIFEVVLERQQSQKVLVEVASEDDADLAREAAWELADPYDWSDDHHDQEESVIASPYTRYWSGGPNGGWVVP